jgi:AcrR family transcriptional regulator
MSSSVTARADAGDASYRSAVRQLLRDRLLDAARNELEGRAWARVTMSEVAATAGVSRQTLYNEFGTRDALGQAVMIREGSRFLDSVEHAIAEHSDDPSAALSAALERFLELAATDPFVALLLGDDGTGGLLPLVTTQSQPVIEWARDRLADTIHAHWPKAPADDVMTLADAVVRLAISHVAAPGGPPDLTAASITRLLAPTIGQMLAGAEPAGRR